MAKTQSSINQLRTKETQVTEEEFNRGINLYIKFVATSLVILILFIISTYWLNINLTNTIMLIGYYLIAIPVISTRYFNIKNKSNSNNKIINWNNFTNKKRKFKFWLGIENMINLLWIIGIVFNIIFNWK